MKTAKQFSYTFNKLKFTDGHTTLVNSELFFSVNMIVQAILELKTSSQSEHIITPIARLYGAVHRLKKIFKRQIQKTNPQTNNFYLLLLDLEETAVQIITTLNLLYISFKEKDTDSLKLFIGTIEGLTLKLIQIKELELLDVLDEALAIYSPIAIYKGNKTLRRKKYLQKKLADNIPNTSGELLDRYMTKMNISKPSGESKES